MNRSAAIVVLCALFGQISAVAAVAKDRFEVRVPGADLYISKGPIPLIPDRPFQDDDSGGAFASRLANYGCEFFQYIRKTQASLDWWRVDVEAYGDTISWESDWSIIFIDGDSTRAVDFVLTQRCDPGWRSCRTLHLMPSAVATVELVSVPMPGGRLPMVIGYVGTPRGRVNHKRVTSVIWMEDR